MPYLICDPTVEDVTAYLVNLDGVMTENPPNIIGGGSKRLYLDVSHVSMGSHSVTVMAKNMWGNGAESDPFEFEKNLPSAPSGVGLSDS